MPLLRVSRVSKHYGHVVALEGLSLEAGAGEILALLGPNGSGKSTLLRLVVTLEAPTSGEIEVDGVSVVERPAEARRLLGYVGQEMAVDKILTGREFLRFQAGLVHRPAAAVETEIDAALEQMRLVEAADRRTATYSGGMRRRVDLAASLLHRPKLVVLDEPSAGLDLESRHALWEILRELRSRGTTLLLATHDFEEADKLADKLVLMDRGHVAGEGTPRALRTRLGSWVASVALHESAEPGDHDLLVVLLDHLGGRVIRGNPGAPEVSVALPDAPGVGDVASARHWVERVEALAADAGLSLFSVAVRRPTLQDVYGAAVGGEFAGVEAGRV
ncbi:MAG: ABC transporter ATP-binding protein [Planctomycetota bacterium]